ncbi:hypothetical protein ONA70_02305 [Micromonospora yasonensis]|uniref:hypothetical protein n=1 Tax=Micromonospora yasonensis TaxID=1128667 RepID=UPI002230B6B8|nr:hypothetical protein [Micromonospora yasonensis]MCW3838927.1 hypothetical protein [Micromonospora yasonensis]
MISSDPRAPRLPRVPHPADSRRLPIYMIIFLVLGIAGFFAHAQADSLKALVFASIISGVFFTCFLIVFAIYWTGYLLKGHAT